MKRVLKIIVLSLFSFVACYTIIALVVWHNVATGHDCEVTNAIRQDVEETMGTNFSRLAVVVSPSRAMSRIHIHVHVGALSQQEMDKFASMADEISRRHGNWKIKIVYVYE